MRKKPIIITTLSILFSTLFINSSVFAGDIEWSGLYRVEGYQIHNSDLTDHQKRDLDYGLQHLILRPKFTAGDGFTIYSQFDVFNSANIDGGNTQMGQYWGAGVNDPPSTASTSQYTSNTLTRTNQAQAINITQLYMTYNHEFGQLIVGRAPLQFGLGMTYSAGRGLFDHFYDTRDLVGYKVIYGNIFVMPMIGKVSQGTLGNSDDMDDYMIQAEYENPESDLRMGVFYLMRHSGDQGSDAPVSVGSGTGQVIGGPNASNNSNCPTEGGCTTTGVSTKVVNLYVLKDSERFRAGMEASFMSGNTGVVDAIGDKVAWGGFGIATEFEYRPEASRWKWGLKAGYATGDDPNNAGTYSGFSFNPNYDVAMLLFNHPLGQNDFFRTAAFTGPVRNTANGSNYVNVPDVEVISNVIYLAPTAKVAFNDHWSLDNTLITGWLDVNPLPHQAGRDVGYEWDATLNYSPRKGVTWINQVGLLLPGAAFRGDSTNPYPHDFAFGLGTKAAISF